MTFGQIARRVASRPSGLFSAEIDRHPGGRPPGPQAKEGDGKGRRSRPVSHPMLTLVEVGGSYGG
jgi:hypothetical protein